MGMSTSAVRAIARSAYLFLLPLVVNYRAMYAEAVDPSSPVFGGGFGRWIHHGHATSRVTDLSSSHLTTLESVTWLDLRAEPLVLTVPATDGATNVRITDLWGFDVEDGAGPDTPYAVVVATADSVLAVPGDVPSVARSESSFCRCAVAVRLAEPCDGDRFLRIRSSLALEPLSVRTGRPTATPAPTVTWWPVPDTVLTGDDFWSVAAFALSLTERHDDDRGILDRLAEVGVRSGMRWDPADLTADHLAAMRDGMDEALTELMRSAGDHRDPTPPGTRAGCDRDYFARAVGALRGLSTTISPTS